MYASHSNNEQRRDRHSEYLRARRQGHGNSHERVEALSMIAFDHKPGLVAYVTCGDPDLVTTQAVAVAAIDAGADIIELGVPFSDPIADGPVIQRATERALAKGANLNNVLEVGETIRKKSEIPLVLFSYYNPLLSYGLERLAARAVKVGFDGILASDLTVEESESFTRAMQTAGLNTIFLVAPTSSANRMKKIAELSTGFLYAVS